MRGTYQGINMAMSPMLVVRWAWARWIGNPDGSQAPQPQALKE